MYTKRLIPVLVLATALILAVVVAATAQGPPDMPSSFYGAVFITGYTPTENTDIVVYLDYDDDDVINTGDTVVATTTVSGTMDGTLQWWLYRVDVYPDPCVNGDALIFEISKPSEAVSDTITVDEDSTDNGIGVLANDVDGVGIVDATATFSSGTNVELDFFAVNLHGLTVTQVSAPVDGSVVYDSSNITYTPDADYCGTDPFEYTITDNNAYTDTATVTVTVTCINDPPTAIDDNPSINEDSGANAIDVLANDEIAPDTGEILSITAVGSASNGTVIFDSSIVTYTPDADYFGTDTFTYTISDGNGGSDTATVTVDVTNVNDDPDANDDSATVAEDSGVNAIDVLVNDAIAPDTGETLSITAVSSASNGTVIFDNSVVTYTPNADYFGTDTFTYTISDGNGGSDTANVNITVTPVNDDPDAVDDNATVVEDSGANAIDVLANDTYLPDAVEPLTITAVASASYGTVIFDSSIVTYTPDADYFGTDTFTYTISDGNGGSDTADVTVNVTNVNDDPDAVDDSPVVDEDSGANAIDVLANDEIAPDTGEILSITAVGSASNGTVIFDSSIVTYTPDADYFGTDTFTYTISDGNGGSDTAIVTVTVTPVNDPPNAVNDSAFVAEGYTVTTLDTTPVTNTVLHNDSDVENDTLTVITTPVSGPSHGSLTLNADGTFTYTHDGSETISDSFRYRVCDDGIPQECAEATVDIDIAPVNDPPTAVNDVAIVSKGGTVTVLDSGAASVLANDSDPEGNNIAVDTSFVVGPSHGSLTLNADGTFSYTHDNTDSYWDSFRYYVCDDYLPQACSLGRVDIVVLIKHEINLQPGWNLVSFNVRPQNTAITEVLSTIDGEYDLIYAWDATGAHASSGNWQLYDSTMFIGGHTLLTLDEKRGFWINVTSTVPISLAVEGAVPYTITGDDGVVPVTTTIDLSTAAGGWNLVGYPSKVNRDLPDVLTDHGVGQDFSLVYAYHADDPNPYERWKLFDRTVLPYFNSLTQMTSGWGYWIMASADNTWSVDYFAP